MTTTVDKATFNKLTTVIELPDTVKDKPLVLLLAEKAAVDILKKENCVFSEALEGLSSETVREKAETTGGPVNESADTTIEF